MTTYLMGGLCLFLALYAMSARWRLLAGAYADAARGRAVARKSLDSIILDVPGKYGGRYAFNPAGVAVHQAGLALNSVVPFSIFARPMFLPFAEMTVRPTSWPGLVDAHAVRMARTAEIELVLSARQLAWLRESGAPV